MRDFTDDLKDSAGAPRRGPPLPAHRRDCGPASPQLETEVQRARPLGRPGPGPPGERRASPGHATTSTLYDAMAQQLDDAETLHELAREEGDESQEPEIEAAVAASNARLDELELRSPLHRRARRGRRHLRRHARDGGADAQDWAEMLLRMYTRWAERRGFEVEVDDVSEGTEAGILSAEFIVSGRYAYGLMQAERGMHRLVRISPFNAQRQRQTSFAAVEVYPSLDDVSAVDIDRQGPAGRHVPLVGGRRPARQQDVVGHPHHPLADGHRRHVPGRAQPAPEPGQGDGQAEGDPGGARRGGAGGRVAPDRRRQPGPGRLGQPDPQLRAAAVPDGEGPAYRPRDRATSWASSTATSTRFMEAYLRWKRAGAELRGPGRLRSHDGAGAARAGTVVDRVGRP